MKRIVTLVFFILGVSRLFAQGVNADCANAINLCNSPSFTFYATSGPGSVVDFGNTAAHNISNPVNDPFPPKWGCLKSGELNPQWLLLTIGNTGLLEFVFGAKNSSNPQAGCYDWSMWPYNDSACIKISNNTLPPVRCNWNGTCQNGTGIASRSRIAAMQWDSMNFDAPLPVNACDRFIICISNYSGVNSLVSFESVGTASIKCTPGSDQAICHGQSASITPLNCPGLINVTYSMNPGNLTSTSGTFVVSPQSSTTYTTYLTGNNPNNGNAVETVTAVTNITVLPQPSIAPTVTNSTCLDSLNGFNLNLSILPLGPTNYSVVYTPAPAGITSHSQTASNDSIGVSPGIYTVTVIADGGCSTTGTFEIAPYPEIPVFNLSPAGPVYSVTCFQPTVTVSSLQAGFNYTWTNGLIAQQTGTSAAFNHTRTGTWTVQAQHPVSNCYYTRTLVIGANTIQPVSSLQPTYQTISCSNPASLVTASANSPTVNFSHMILSPLGGTYVANSSTVGYQPGTVGTFSHFLVNTVNGCRTLTQFTVTSNEGFPTFSLTSSRNFTIGCNSRNWTDINIFGAQATPTSPGAVSYTLLPPGSSTVLPPTGTLSTASAYTVNLPGSYTVVTRNTANNCDTRVAVSVLTNTLPPSIDTLMIPTDLLSCFTPSVLLKGVSFSPDVSYRWLLPNNISQAGDQHISQADFSARTETIRATYTFEVTDNSSTCTNTAVVVILQNLFAPLAEISGMLPLTCKTPTVLLSNNSQPDPANPHPKGKPVVAYEWTGPSPQVPLYNTSSYLAYYPGTYTMNVRDMNNGCVATATALVPEDRRFPVVNNPVVPPPDTLDCGAAFAKVEPIIEVDLDELEYSWSGPQGYIFSGSDKEKILQPDRAGEYRLLVTNTLTGCAVQVKMNVVSGKLTAAIDASLTSEFAPAEAVFHNNSASSLGSDSINAIWSFGNGVDTSLNSVSSVYTGYTQPGTYTVTLYVQKGECIDTAYHVVHLEIPSALEIPNVFTPNGDGVNDEFFLHTANLSNIEILIIDRWGNKVYELTSGTGNIMWDGRNQFGKESPDGNYLYVLKATGKDGKSYDQKGNITLVR